MLTLKVIERRGRRLCEEAMSLAQATKACKHWAEESRESCIYDVMSTGDLMMARSGYLFSQEKKQNK